MADRWMDERDREWRDRDWRRSETYGRTGEDRGRPGEPRHGEDRSWSGASQDERGGPAYDEPRRRRMSYDEDEEDYGGRSGVASGPGGYGRGGRPQAYQGGRHGGPPRIQNQDYTGRGRVGERDDDDYGYRHQRPGGGGPEWRGGSSPERGRGRGGWEAEAERRFGESRRWPSGGYDEERGYDEGRRAAARGRAPWEDHREPNRGEGPTEFLQRAGERISSWFRGDPRGRDDEREAPPSYRQNLGREAGRPDRGHRGIGPKGYQRTDERISDEVHDRLTEDPWLDASNIEVAVKDGEVTLSGHVENREAKHRAERLIEDLFGVRHVQNNLRVAPNAGFTGAGRGFGSSALEAEMRRHEQALDPGNNGVSGLSGRTSTGAAAERSTTTNAPVDPKTKRN
ncbi:BON domain-containing protein [Phenylobacterium sp. LjRoot219]|uniref:BON domain-containing protein n=1 Tax=Phenylobacterium sp. LjRoot219 TaxID=3342283 RepID=UPI003ECCFAA6